MSLRRYAALLVLLVLVGAAQSPAEAGRLHWTADHCVDFACPAAEIVSVDLDGSDIQTLLAYPDASFGGLAIDAASNRVYWGHTDCRDGNYGSIWSHKVRQASIEGCSVVSPSSGWVRFVELDPASNKLYWMSGDHSIRRADLDPVANVEQIVGPFTQGRGLALDLVHDKMYWRDSFGIWRGNLDGTGPELLVEDEWALSLAVDGAGGMLYWTNWTHLRRSALDGSDPTDLIAINVPGTAAPLELDTVHGKIYWADNNGCFVFPLPTIMRADLDGSNAEEFLSMYTAVGDLAIDPEGDGIGPVACDPQIVPAVGLEGGLVLGLALLVLSGRVVRRRRKDAGA